MAWYRLTFQARTTHDLARADGQMAQRLFDKTKWIASNVDNLRHESIAEDLLGVHKYAVGDWRIFYAIDRKEQLIDIYAIVHKRDLLK